MAITLSTNLTAYSSRLNLNGVISDLTDTMSRISSGLKINSAGDDAAGLVISENMEATIKSSKQAMANIQAAESFLTVAEQGMVSIGDHFQRINDLLTNMANDTNDLDSRNAAVMEIIERIDEINRLARSTNYNGRKMLDGSETSIIVQCGADSTEDSILDISPALSKCTVSALKADIPAALHPDSRADGDTIYKPSKDADGNEIFIADDGTTIDKQAFEALKEGSGFNPTNASCRAYMGTIQEAIATLSTQRGLIGAYENRIQSSYDAISTRVECLEAGKSIYTDADIAEESTNFSRQQILQQVNISILAQANTMQQNALSLLGF